MSFKMSCYSNASESNIQKDRVKLSNRTGTYALIQLFCKNAHV